MLELTAEIKDFLEGNGFGCSVLMRDGFEVIVVTTLDGRHRKTVLPLHINASSIEEAARNSEDACRCIDFIRAMEGYPLIITEDRWRKQKVLMQTRLLAHLELFSQAFARNCEVRKIDKIQAKTFLNENHSYGYAACRYCYGLFQKRATGHNESQRTGKLLAVATFSNARTWMKGEQVIRSYEWTRYASLPDLRINGGMGKVLKMFIKEVRPDDIMSYADLEWSEGNVYRALGFKTETDKKAVDFIIDRQTWERVPIRSGRAESCIRTDNLYFRNFGSKKFRLKLTDYE